ncbi:V-type proton ATPase subunit G 3 isoform X3 [Moschus berezovskii]|uniref:V-type proton ATPase subunit G 3 isoform X3 n=1 Tax=Moschus berezovskii TaxID=68408 RepID=UPI002444E1C0|nr:V-type proton ATPase subunit G 3 isoform X3 [Moschus berezovskii]
MTSQSQGIHQLLQTEKRAKDKLEEAKKRKVKRLRQAKEEAMAETNQYRIQRDEEFRQKQAKGVEKNEPFYTVGGSINWYSLNGEWTRLAQKGGRTKKI